MAGKSVIQLPAGHVEICRHADEKFAIAISRCRVSECSNFHVFIESFGNKHGFVYCPEDDETIESALTVMFKAALDIVTGTAQEEMRFVLHVN